MAGPLGNIVGAVPPVPEPFKVPGMAPQKNAFAAPMEQPIKPLQPIRVPGTVAANAKRPAAGVRPAARSRVGASFSPAAYAVPAAPEQIK